MVSDVHTNGSLTRHSIGVTVGFCINADRSEEEKKKRGTYNLRSIQMTVCMCCNIRILIKPSTNNGETYRTIEAN